MDSNAFQPTQSGTSAFVPPAQTAQMQAGGASSSPWSSLNQFLVGNRQAQAERRAFDEAQLVQAQAASVEQARYDTEQDRLNVAQERQKQQDAQKQQEGIYSTPQGQFATRYNPDSNSFEEVRVGDLSPTQQAALDKAKSPKGGGKHFWAQAAGSKRANTSVAQLFAGVNVLEDGSFNMANEGSRQAVNTTATIQRKLAEHYEDISAPKLNLLAGYSKRIATGLITEEEAIRELNDVYGVEQAPVVEKKGTTTSGPQMGDPVNLPDGNYPHNPTGQIMTIQNGKIVGIR